MKYFVYYEKPKNHYRYYDGNKFRSTTSRNEIKCGFFEIHQSYECKDEDLKRYYDSVPVWNEQIKSKFTKCKFDYLDKLNDMIAVEHFCLLFCKKSMLTHDSITFTEQQWTEKCNNVGIQSCRPTEKAIKVYSYDGRGFYQYALANEDFFIPHKHGYETTLEKLPKRKDLKHGFYNVKITSDNPNAKMVFSFNTQHVYYYYDLYFAMKHKKILDLHIELLQNANQPNAYVYDSVIPSSTVFAKWNQTINGLKKEHPDNKLLKNLGSKCWGVMSKRCQITVNDEELTKNFEEYKNHEVIRTTKIGEWNTPEYIEYHVLQDPEKPYKHNIRLKAQITSFCRTLIGSYAIKDINNLVRIHTDCMTFKRPFPIIKKIFKREEKSSGMIHFYNCNTYKHECWKCHKEYKYKDLKSHCCDSSNS